MYVKHFRENLSLISAENRLQFTFDYTAMQMRKAAIEKMR